MSGLTLWLIRHGESAANAGIWDYPQAQIPLTEKGRQQALQLATAVPTRPDLIIVSSFKRTYDSAAPMMDRWQDSPVEIWPIQEFTYLAFAKWQNIHINQRRAMIHSYWQRADPLYCDGAGAESFADFIQRVQAFQQRLLALEGFIVAVGHGQFFKAFQLGRQKGFAATSDWMRQFRTAETAKPIANGEIIKLSAESFS